MERDAASVFDPANWCDLHTYGPCKTKYDDMGTDQLKELKPLQKKVSGCAELFLI